MISEKQFQMFLLGQLPMKESLIVINEIKKDPELRRRYIGVLRFDAMEEAEKRDSLPLESLAAKTEDNMCVLKCERFVLEQKYKNYNNRTDVAQIREEHAFVSGLTDTNRLAWINGNQEFFSSEEEQRWLTSKGVALYNIGRVLESYGLSVIRRFKCTIDQIKDALAKEMSESVIAVVNEDILQGKGGDDTPNHAVCILSIEKDQITLYNPSVDAESVSYPLNKFLSAWDTSRDFAVFVNFKGVNVYDPHPEDIVGSEELSDSLNDLTEAMAEHLHDVWARGRLDQGWRYGKKRDDDKLLNPDLVAYSDLPESEKVFDRQSAQMLLKLLQRLGYVITRNSEDDHHCPNCGKKITLDMAYCSECGRYLQPDDFMKD